MAILAPCCVLYWFMRRRGASTIVEVSSLDGVIFNVYMDGLRALGMLCNWSVNCCDTWSCRMLCRLRKSIDIINVVY